jgi:hypothetical protein
MGLNLPSNTEVKAAGARGLELGAEHILQVAQLVVPLEEGTLSRSGVASVDEDSLKAAVSFDTVYAVNQHESLDFKHAQGRTAKYLEGPLNSEADVVKQIIADEIRAVLGT